MSRQLTSLRSTQAGLFLPTDECWEAICQMGDASRALGRATPLDQGARGNRPSPDPRSQPLCATPACQVDSVACLEDAPEAPTQWTPTDPAGREVPFVAADRALARATAKLQVSAVGLGDTAGKRQANAAALHVPRVLAAIQLVEDMRQVIDMDAATHVGHLDGSR
jgi:hypothetical protein